MGSNSQPFHLLLHCLLCSHGLLFIVFSPSVYPNELLLESTESNSGLIDLNSAKFGATTNELGNCGYKLIIDQCDLSPWMTDLL